VTVPSSHADILDATFALLSCQVLRHLHLHAFTHSRASHIQGAVARICAIQIISLDCDLVGKPDATRNAGGRSHDAVTEEPTMVMLSLQNVAGRGRTRAWGHWVLTMYHIYIHPPQSPPPFCRGWSRSTQRLKRLRKVRFLLLKCEQLLSCLPPADAVHLYVELCRHPHDNAMTYITTNTLNLRAGDGMRFVGGWHVVYGHTVKRTLSP